MPKEWRGINDLYFHSSKDKDETKHEAVSIEEDSAQNENGEPEVRLSEGTFIQCENGFQFNNKCTVQVKVEYLKETPRKKVTFKLFSIYNGEIEDMGHQAEGFEENGYATAELTLFNNEAYYKDMQNNPDTKVKYYFTASHTKGVREIESERLEMPREEENEQRGINIDFNFISEREGGRHTEGYVPLAGQSGVTIGTGIDIGQWDSTGLQNMGVSQDLIDLFEPYLGLTRDDAEEYLNNNPLTITDEQAAELDENFMQNYFQPLINNYNAASDVNYEDLPTEAQTVIASVAYQYGTDLASATPNFWQQVTTQDWQAGVDNLRGFGDDYSTRRNIEAHLLDDLLEEE